MLRSVESTRLLLYLLSLFIAIRFQSEINFDLLLYLLQVSCCTYHSRPKINKAKGNSNILFLFLTGLPDQCSSVNRVRREKKLSYRKNSTASRSHSVKCTHLHTAADSTSSMTREMYITQWNSSWVWYDARPNINPNSDSFPTLLPTNKPKLIIHCMQYNAIRQVDEQAHRLLNQMRCKLKCQMTKITYDKLRNPARSGSRRASPLSCCIALESLAHHRYQWSRLGSSSWQWCLQCPSFLGWQH